jgi:hypothetical protein
MHRRRVRTPRHVEDIADDLLVIPARGEFRLAWRARSMPVPAARNVTAKYVRNAFRAHPECIWLRAALGVYRAPASHAAFCRVTVLRMDRLAGAGA